MNDDERRLLERHYERKIELMKQKHNTRVLVLVASISSFLLSADYEKMDILSLAAVIFGLVAVATLFVEGIRVAVDSFCYSEYGQKNKINTAITTAIFCAISFLVGGLLR